VIVIERIRKEDSEEVEYQYVGMEETQMVE